jgi:hypothetical protein
MRRRFVGLTIKRINTARAKRDGNLVMIDKAVKYLSMLSFAVLYLTALFNIGYFLFVGIHFIGVIDVSNIVYTFALIFMFLIIFLMLGSLLEFLFRRIGDLGIPLNYIPASLRIATGFVLIVAALIGFAFLATQKPKGYPAVLFLFVGTILAIAAYKQWKKTNVVEFGLIGGSIVFTSFGVLVVGAAIAQQQRDNPLIHYDVITKSGSFNDVRIMRSSSSGVIFAQDSRMIFVPSGEIRLIVATGSEFVE